MNRRLALLACGAAATLAASGLLAVTLPASAAATGCSVTYTVQSQWPGGFSTNIAITNLGSPITSWALAFDLPNANQKVTQGWSATWSQSGARVSAASMNWNGALGTGASTSVGFVGSWSGANPIPASFTLNGTLCDGVVPSPTVSPTGTSPTPTPTTSPTASPTASPTDADADADADVSRRCRTGAAGGREQAGDRFRQRVPAARCQPVQR